MNHQMLAACGAVALGTSLAAFAQPAVNARTGHKPEAAQLQYTSAFEDYKPWQDIPAGNWRQANDVVGAAAARRGAPVAGAAMAMPVPMAATRPAGAASAPAATMPPMKHGGHAGHGVKP